MSLTSPESEFEMITGRRYLLRGQSVTVLIQWATPRPAAGELALPLVRTRSAAPRNVMIRHNDGTLTVRPFRGLTRLRDHDTPPD